MNRPLQIKILPFLRGTALKRGAIFGVILFAALLAFEVFNFSTTSFALRDMLGDLTFMGFRWATVLAIAFCGIDFAGIARIFTPEQGRDEPAEIWYLFGAWVLAAGFNAMLTWWGVSVAIMNHNAEGGALVGQAAMTKVVPIVVAFMVWLVRLLIIGTFSVAGERLFTIDEARPTQQAYSRPVSNTYRAPTQPRTSNIPAASYVRSTPQSTPASSYIRPEPTYHPVGLSAQEYGENQSMRS
ncbi:MAG TPA: hypothetical protein VMT73_07640 [Anaerolineales bacterium]|nr:hypothetical protein [Anaerolineales bacterium]